MDGAPARLGRVQENRQKLDSVGAGVWRQRDVEEVLLHGGDGGCGEGLAAGWGGDDGDELEVGDGCAGDVDALGIGAGVRGGEEEAGVVEGVVEEGDVDGGEAFELVFGAEGEAEPEAFGAGAREEGAAGEALGVDGVGEVEVADVADVLDVVEGEGDDPAAEVEEVYGFVADEGREGKVSGEDVSREAAHEYLFVSGGHRSGGLSHSGGAGREKAEWRVVNSLMLCYIHILCLA